jgi:hypothetical protein
VGSQDARRTSDSAYEKLHAIIDPDHIVIGESITEDEAAALLGLSREVEVLRAFYEATCDDLLAHDTAHETVKTTVERIREIANKTEDTLRG